MNPMEQKLQADLKVATFKYRQAEVEQKQIQATMEKLKWQIDYVSGLLGLNDQKELPADRSTPVLPPTGNAGVPMGDYEGMASPKVIEAVLRTAGHKMRVPAIVDAAVAKGYGGLNPDKKKLVVNFASVLMRAVKDREHPVFKKAGRGFYTVKEAVSTGE